MTLDYLHLLSFVIALHLTVTTYRTGLAGHTGLKISNTTPFNLLPSPFFLPTTPEYIVDVYSNCKYVVLLLHMTL